MRCQKLVIAATAGILMATATLWGCSSNLVSLKKQGLVSVEKQSSRKVKILWTDVYEKDGQTWAYGILKQPPLSRAAIKTHVDIQVLNSDGSIEYETVSKELYVPRNRVGRGPDWKRFKVRLPNELPTDAQICMKVHSSPH